MSTRHQAKSRTDAFSVTADMTSAQVALERLLKDTPLPKKTEQVKLREALGRTLARTVYSGLNIPPFDNSAVDGFAIQHQYLKKNEPSTFEITDRIVAGAPGAGGLGDNKAAQIFTGAPIPDGADTVVPMEVCTVEDGFVTIPFVKAPGQNIRPAGEDIKKNTAILKEGTGLRPQDIALAASIGEEELTVFTPPSVAVFSTGSEILDPGDGRHYRSGLRYDSNRYLLLGLCERLGCRITDLGILDDNKDQIRETFQKLKGKYDLVLTSGGISSSEEDHVKQAFEAAGGKLDLWKVAIRPGRPLAFGKAGSTFFMGLPGNPVATFVTYSIFTRPLILRMSGVSHLDLIKIPVRTNFEIKKRVGRREWLRVWITRDKNNQLLAEKYPSEGSGILSSIVVTDGLLELPDELSYVNKGDVMDFLPFTPFAPF